MRPILYSGFVLALMGMSVLASPQQPQSPPVLSVETDLVTLSVTVVDSRGALVTGLRQQDFTVFDDGEPQAIQFFASEDVPATVGLVMDSSGSMRGRRDRIVAAAEAFAAMSHPADEFFTMNFNDFVWPGLPSTVAFTSDRGQLRASLFATPAVGMSAMYDAIGDALDHLEQGSHDRRALIVVSDGGDNASSHSFDVILERARHSRAAIYSVTLFDLDDHDARPRILKKLAGETGGVAYTPRRAEDVMPAFTQIARALRSGYTIGFMPSDTSEDGFRPVRVVADAGDGRRLIARTRAGYYVGP